MKSEITSGLACHLISMAVGSSLTAGSFILAFSVMSKGPITAEASYEPEANTKKQGIITESDTIYEEKEEKPAGGKRYVCKVCGYVYEGDTLPEDYKCPICGAGPQYFAEQQ